MRTTTLAATGGIDTIQWSDMYLIGLTDLDDDHRRIVALVADLHAAAVTGAGAAELSAMLDNLMECFHDHVSVEEGYLARLTDPAGRKHSVRHVAEHAAFFDRLAALRGRLANGEDVAVEVDSLGVFLTLTELIRSDFEMVGHLRREGLMRSDGTCR
ncbi:MAG: bacteriohemerythrin [Actinomycetota bacterium]